MPIPSNDAAKRIRKSVKYTEAQRPSREGPKRKFIPQAFILGVFRLTGTVTKDGANNRWVYDAKKLGPKVGAGYAGSWPDDTGDTTTYQLYSFAEKVNGSSGTYGNGVSQANLDAVNGATGTHAIKPLTTDNPVLAVGQFLDDGTLEWWIPNWPNGVDGACPT